MIRDNMILMGSWPHWCPRRRSQVIQKLFAAAGDQKLLVPRWFCQRADCSCYILGWNLLIGCKPRFFVTYVHLGDRIRSDFFFRSVVSFLLPRDVFFAGSIQPASSGLCWFISQLCLLLHFHSSWCPSHQAIQQFVHLYWLTMLDLLVGYLLDSIGGYPRFQNHWGVDLPFRGLQFETFFSPPFLRSYN